MPLTEEQKHQLDQQFLPGPRRLSLVSHAEIEETIAKALESLVGGHYRVHIKSWAEGQFSNIFEKIETSATIEAYHPEAEEAVSLLKEK
jgi:hypothetical protein